MRDLIEQALELAEDREDVKDGPHGFVANEWMQVAELLRRALAALTSPPAPPYVGHNYEAPADEARVRNAAGVIEISNGSPPAGAEAVAWRVVDPVAPDLRIVSESAAYADAMRKQGQIVTPLYSAPGELGEAERAVVEAAVASHRLRGQGHQLQRAVVAYLASRTKSLADRQAEHDA